MKVLSLNARGLRNGLKWRKIFRYIKRQNADICMLQESHATKDIENLWSAEWGNKIIYANGSSQAGGSMLLLNRKIANCLKEINRDMNGRYIVTKLEINEYSYCIASLYAPNNDDPEFFVNFFELVQKTECTHTIVGGDFNTDLDPALDRSENRWYHNESRRTILAEMEKQELEDVWRLRNPEVRRLTWSRLRPIQWSRIDFFLVSTSIVTSCIDADILPCVNSDHSAIVLECKVDSNKRGPGVWKFNDTLLNHEEFCEKMSEVLKGSARVYSYMHPFDRWEEMKSEAIEYSKEYARSINKKDKQDKFRLYQLLGKMQQKVVDLGSNVVFNSNIERVQREIDSYETADAKRAAFRCRANWNLHGEKSSKFFFNMEKRNYCSKTMYVCKRNDGSLTKDYREILNLQYEFYDKLYTRDSNVEFTLNNEQNIRLSQAKKEEMDKELVRDELFDAIMTLKVGKTPGCDGLTLAFYRKFYNVIADALLAVAHAAIREGKLNCTARRGIVNLIPKRNKSKLEIKDWRGITLLNYDYKVIAKAIANRLETVVNDVVGLQQTGFIPGRHITSNIRRTHEIVSYLRRKNLPGIIAVIDFEKCFDRVEHESIRKTFQYFGFGDYFVKLLMILFADFEICTSNGGFLSEFIKKGRGINQGCPASPLVYIFCGETLNHVVQSNKTIKGVPMDTIDNLLSQFADNTSAFLKYDQISLNAFSEALQCIEKNLGLKVSYDKTTLYRVGSLCDSEASLYTAKSFKWSCEPIEILGVYIACNGEIVSKNYEEIIKKVKETCNVWFNRQLSLTGKILVINSLIGSLFVYKMQTMLNLSHDQIKEVENIISQFIWKNKRPRIGFRTLTRKKSQGGLKLVDLSCKQDALKIDWIFRLESDPFLADCALQNLDKHLGLLIWYCNLSYKDAVNMYRTDNFWHQVLRAWSKINYSVPATREEILEQVIWLNSQIRIENKPVKWGHWINRGIVYIEDMVNGNNFKTAEELRVNWLEHSALLKAFPNFWKERINEEQISVEESRKALYSKLFPVKKRARVVYDILIDDESLYLKYARRWFGKLDESTKEPLEWFKQSFVKLLQCTNITLFCDFQYRLNLNKIVTNNDLSSWGKHDTGLCTFCKTENETLKHLLFECTYSKKVIKHANTICGQNIDENYYKYVFNVVVEPGAHIVNFVTVFLKHFLYSCRCQKIKPSELMFEKKLEAHVETERFNAKREKTYTKFVKRWSPIIEII